MEAESQKKEGTVTIPLEVFKKMEEDIQKVAKFRDELADAGIAVLYTDENGGRDNFYASYGIVKFPSHVKGYKNSEELSDSINDQIETAKHQIIS